jgi:hypothetical protein
MCIDIPKWNWQVWGLSAKSLFVPNWEMWLVSWLCVCEVLVHSIVSNWVTRWTGQLDWFLLLLLWVCTVKYLLSWCALSWQSMDWKIHGSIFRYGVCLVVLSCLYQSLKAHIPACCLARPLPLWSLTEHLACSSSRMNPQNCWKLGCVNVLLFDFVCRVFNFMIMTFCCFGWYRRIYVWCGSAVAPSGIVICTKFHCCHWWISLLYLQVIGRSLDKSRKASDYEQQKKRFRMLQLFRSIFLILCAPISSLLLES